MGGRENPERDLQHLDTFLLAAVRAAPRRYRMPPLPADADAAASIGVDAALAFAIEAMRMAREHGSTPPVRVQDMFTHALAALISRALAAEGGDLGFQALVLQSHCSSVGEYVRLAAQAAGDRRTVCAAIDAVAHPGKLRDRPAGAARDALARLHRLTAEGAWAELATTVEQPLPPGGAAQQQVCCLLKRLRANPALQRLARGSALLRNADVQRYVRLTNARGPLAGSDAAAASGRASARLGQLAEGETAQAFGAIVDLLNRRGRHGAVYRVLRSLRPPVAFPGERNKAKDEWDAAIVRSDKGGGDDIVLLAEVKASAAAASADFSRAAMVHPLDLLSAMRGGPP